MNIRHAIPALALTLGVANVSAQNKEDSRICTQPFGPEQVIQVSCENITSILRLHPGFKATPTIKGKRGDSFNQTTDKEGNPILYIYTPPRKSSSVKEV